MVKRETPKMLVTLILLMEEIPNNHRLDGAQTPVHNGKTPPTSTGELYSRISEPSTLVLPTSGGGVG